MVSVNGSMVPTCADLAKYLEQMGDVPLFSGYGWYAVTGFRKTETGTQIAVMGCPPLGKFPKDNRQPKEGGL